MKKLKILYLVLIALLLTGCPIESKFEVGKIVSIDRNLIGQWNEIQNDSDEKLTIIIQELNSENYDIKCMYNSKEPSDTLNFKGSIRELKTGETILQTSFDTGSYSYFKYSFSKNRLKINFLNGEQYNRFTNKDSLENLLTYTKTGDWSGEIILKK